MTSRLAILGLLVATFALAEPASALAPAPTVFGAGAEVHLLPSFGPVGTRVKVVGLGYRPGTTIKLMWGVPNAEYAGSLGKSRVGVRGRFTLSFKAPTAWKALPGKGLIIGALGSNQYAQTGFVVGYS